MEWNEKLQVIIDYVENHLQRKEELIDSDEISKIAECSFGFFQNCLLQCFASLPPHAVHFADADINIFINI